MSIMTIHTSESRTYARQIQRLQRAIWNREKFVKKKLNELSELKMKRNYWIKKIKEDFGYDYKTLSQIKKEGYGKRNRVNNNLYKTTIM